MMLKLYLPIIKSNLPMLEKLLCEKITSEKLIVGEQYAAYVLTSVKNSARLSLCAFDGEDRCVRVITSESLLDVVTNMLKNASK